MENQVEEDRENEILKILKQEGEKQGLPSRFLDFYRDLFIAQLRGEQRIGNVNPGITKETIDERLVNGQPLITYSDFHVDYDVVNDLFINMTSIFSEYKDLFGELPKSLTRPISRKTLPKGLIKAWFKGTRLPASYVTDDPGEHSLLEAVVHATLKPFFLVYAKAVSGLIDQTRWRRTCCPVCGGIPDFSYLDKDQGSRWLVCSRCDTSWLFQRLQCPFCGSQDQKDLSYLSDDTGMYRLYLCRQCRKYIKAIDLRATAKKILLPVERITTLMMDSQARDEGYEPGNSL